jgi:hypothetical protein
MSLNKTNLPFKQAYAFITDHLESHPTTGNQNRKAMTEHDNQNRNRKEKGSDDSRRKTLKAFDRKRAKDLSKDRWPSA